MLETIHHLAREVAGSAGHPNRDDAQAWQAALAGFQGGNALPAASQPVPSPSPLPQPYPSFKLAAPAPVPGPADPKAAAARVLDSGKRPFARDNYEARMKTLGRELQMGDAQYRSRLMHEILVRDPHAPDSWLTSQRADILAGQGHITAGQRSLIAEAMADPATKVQQIKTLLGDQGTAGTDRTDHMKQVAALLTSGSAADMRAVLAGLSDGDLAKLAGHLEHGGVIGVQGLNRDQRDDLFNAIASKADATQLVRLMEAFGERAASDPDTRHEPVFDTTTLLAAVGNSAPADVKTAFIDALAGTGPFSAVSRLGQFTEPGGKPVWDNEDQRFALASMLIQDPSLTPAKLTHDQEMAQLALASYKAPSADLSGTIPDHYERVTDFTSDPRLKGLSASDFTDRQTGFDAALFRDKRTGDYVLSFRGSDNLFKDYSQANIPQGLGFDSKQYDKAISLAGDLKDALGPDLTDVTGHSLGGGLAAAAGMSIDTATTTFDAAGVHPFTLPRNLEWANDSVVTNYRVKGELLSQVQEKSFVSRGAIDAAGRQITIEAFDKAGPGGQILSHQERKDRGIGAGDLHGQKFVASGMLVEAA